MKFNLSVAVGVAFICAIVLLLFMLPADTGGRATSETSPLEEPETYNQPRVEAEETYVMSISADNYTYHSRDDVNLTIDITVPRAMNGTTIHLFGIKNKYGIYRNERYFEMDLAEGENIIETKTNVPRCYGCSGIEPGIFQFHAVLYYNETPIINASTDIEILE